MDAKKDLKRRQARDYTFTPAQETMRKEMEAREPVKLGDALDELFVQMGRKVTEQEADRRYPETVLAPENEDKAEAFIAGAEWWASYGL